MTPTILSALALALAAVPALLFLRNLPLYRTPVAPEGYRAPSISVLIPARDEESSIDAAVTSTAAMPNSKWWCSMTTPRTVPQGSSEA